MSRSSRTFSSDTWIRSARSGSSFRQNTPRLVRGTSPKWIVSGSPSVRPPAPFTPVQVTDSVPHAVVSGPHLLADTKLGVPARHEQVLALVGRYLEDADTGRRERMVVDLASAHRGSPLVEHAEKPPDRAGLAL